MKVYQWFFVLSLGFLLFVISLFFVNIAPGSTGVLHENYQTMLHSGPGTKGLSLQLGFFIGLFVLGIFTFCLIIGNQRRGQMGPMRKWFWAGVLGYFVVYGIQVYLYWRYDPSQQSQFLGGFPLPTAWMIYAMWSFPLIFTIIYLLTFNNWVFTKEDETTYQALKKEYQSQTKNT